MFLVHYPPGLGKMALQTVEHIERIAQDPIKHVEETAQAFYTVPQQMLQQEETQQQQRYPDHQRIDLIIGQERYEKIKRMHKKRHL